MLERNRTSSSDHLRYSGTSNEREFVSLSDIFAFTQRFWVTIAVFAALGISCAFFYVLTTSDRYVATAQILIEPKIAPLGSQQPTDINLSLDTAQIESQIAVLQSEKIAKMVIKELKLEDDPVFLRSPSPSITKRIKRFALMIGEAFRPTPENKVLNADAANPKASIDEGVTEIFAGLSDFERSRVTMYIFQEGLEIKRVGVSYAIQISFASLDPQLSAQVANAVADAYMREQIENRAMEARAGTAWLESRLNELRGLMNQATKAQQAFLIKHDYSIRDEANTVAPGPDSNAEDGNGVNSEPTLEELQVTSDTYKRMYESFLQAYTNSVNQQTYSPPNARIITAAAAPLTPSYPRPKLVLAFGLVAGLLAGVGGAFARQTLDNSVRTQQQIREEFGLECLGVLPPPPRFASSADRYSIIPQFPPSTFSQNLASIRTVIDFAESGRSVRLLGVIATLPGDGKSMLAANLATLSAMNGVRTLLIDADIHQSPLQKKVPQPESKILNYVMHAEVLDNIVPVERHSFDLLSSKAISGNRTLSTNELRAILEKLDIYEQIIIDLPDMRSGIDAAVICPLLDGVVISTKWGRTPTGQVKELVRLLYSLKTTLLGVVITNFGGK